MTRESLTPSERVMRARMAAYMLHTRYDPRETTKPARRAFNSASSTRSTPTTASPTANATAAPKPPAAPTSLAWRSCRRRVAECMASAALVEASRRIRDSHFGWRRLRRCLLAVPPPLILTGGLSGPLGLPQNRVEERLGH